MKIIELLFFNQDGCPPCQDAKQIVNQADRYRNVIVRDIKAGTPEFDQYDFDTVPIVMLSVDGNIIGQYHGIMDIEDGLLTDIQQFVNTPQTTPTNTGGAVTTTTTTVVTDNFEGEEESGGFGFFGYALGAYLLYRFLT